MEQERVQERSLAEWMDLLLFSTGHRPDSFSLHVGPKQKILEQASTMSKALCLIRGDQAAIATVTPDFGIQKVEAKGIPAVNPTNEQIRQRIANGEDLEVLAEELGHDSTRSLAQIKSHMKGRGQNNNQNVQRYPDGRVMWTPEMNKRARTVQGDELKAFAKELGVSVSAIYSRRYSKA